jgi:hypothetical protein
MEWDIDGESLKIKIVPEERVRVE